jgi:2'-5' RNA ligase
LTLVFLGYRPEREIPRIASTAFAAVGGLPAPRLVPDEIKAVPPRRPRLFALGLEDLDGGAAAVQAAVSDALEATGLYRPEKRPFWPHVTLARVKANQRAEPLVAPAPPAAELQAAELTLYRSTLRREGALYEPLRQHALG